MSTDSASQFQDGGRLAGQADVAIVVDSACCLTPDLIRRWNITLVPHELLINGRSYRDGVDISPGEFYKILRDSRVVPTTAAPRRQEFLDGMLAAGELASNILCVTVSANFSVANRSALAAVETVGERLPHCRIKVIDSQAAAGALGLIALAAARWAHEDCGLDQIAARLDRLIPRVNLLAFFDSFDYQDQGVDRLSIGCQTIDRVARRRSPVVGAATQPPPGDGPVGGHHEAASRRCAGGG